MTQSKLLNNVQKLKLPMLLLPAALLTGCATPSTSSAPASPALPLPPSLSEPIPQQSYSERASTNIGAWRNRLIGTLQTQ